MTLSWQQVLSYKYKYQYPVQDCYIVLQAKQGCIAVYADIRRIPTFGVF